ncbi:MAG: class I SAM-dependent methyltransferase [Candidatus Hydrogenedentota bacterium]
MHDTFHKLAKHYDGMMSHVDYERWIAVSTLIADLCPDDDFYHLDIGCGTGNLLEGLRDYGWRSVGIDLSHAMIETARDHHPELPVAQADMTQLPFHNVFHFATSVFDSVNFLLSHEALVQACKSIRGALTDSGVLYFDFISEAMVLEHFADKDWVDRIDGIDIRWRGVYDSEARIIENTIWSGMGDPSVVRERVHSLDEIREALEAVGMRVLGVFDTESWSEPSATTLRYDVVACVGDAQELDSDFRRIREDVRLLLSDGKIS